jgi:hydroxyethylthiazole kinase
VLRKYLLLTAKRQAHFLGQAAVESGQLKYMRELYNGDPYAYFRKYECARNYEGWLGNVQWNDGALYRGRGFKQLTGRANYAAYFLYRGLLSPNSFSARWWTDNRWWGLQLPYVPTKHKDLLPIQNTAALSRLVQAKRPPFVDDPERVASDAYTAIDTAGYFWAANKLYPLADADDYIRLTNRIRGDNAVTATDFRDEAHFPERRENVNRIKDILL